MKKFTGIILLLALFTIACEELPEAGIEGCTDEFACNFIEDAVIDDESCQFPPAGLNCDGDILGCIDTLACNFDSIAEADTGACEYPVPGLNCDGEKLGCNDPVACNYDETAEANDGSCVYPPPGQDCSGLLYGCTDDNYLEYYTQGFVADLDDGSCQTLAVFGCMDPAFCSFNPQANLEDGSCSGIPGCNDPTACNYDVEADCDDGSCTGLFGCTDPGAYNYNPQATCDDGTCKYVVQTLLNNGQTPLQIINDGYLLDSLYGCTYMGGQIFHFDASQNRGLVLCPTDLTIGDNTWPPNNNTYYSFWGCESTNVGTSYALYSGAANTIAIENSFNYGTLANPFNSSSPCATNTNGNSCVNPYGVNQYKYSSLIQNFSNGGYTDWYIPSFNELVAIFNNLVVPGHTVFGPNSEYISSSESTSNINGINIWFKTLPFVDANGNLDGSTNFTRQKCSWTTGGVQPYLCPIRTF